METGTKLAFAQLSEGGMTAEKDQIVGEASRFPEKLSRTVDRLEKDQIVAEASRFAEKLSRTVDRLADSSPIEKTPVAREMWNALKADMRKIWTRDDPDSSGNGDLKAARP